MRDNPFNYGLPVSGKQFVGRWDQVMEAVDDLCNPGGHSLMIVGGRRFGKTSFLEVLQATLIEQLNQAQPGESYLLPILVSLDRLEDFSPGGVFALILRTLYSYFYSPFHRRMLGLTFSFDVHIAELDLFIQSKEQSCSLDRFSSMLGSLLDTFHTRHGILRLAFLLDETEKILDQEWTDKIFSQIRSLVYVDVLHNYIRCVLAGSSKIIEVRQKGSPLLNMLKEFYLEALKDEGIREIIDKADTVSVACADAVLAQSGGQPFLAQYIMHYWWEHKSKGREFLLPSIVNKFCLERYGDLKQWCNDIGQAGLLVYKVLVEVDGWLSRAQIGQRLSGDQASVEVSPALSRLRYHGLIRYDLSLDKYHAEGELFKKWFLDEILPTLRLPVSSQQLDPLKPSFSYREPEITISLYDSIFPTPYCHAIAKEDFPLITCSIDNRGDGCAAAKVTIKASIQGFTETVIDSRNIPAGKFEQIFLLPKPSSNAMSRLTEICEASCHVEVEVDTENGSRSLLNKTYSLYLQARDTALLAHFDQQARIWKDLADYLAVFVMPRCPEIQELTGVAAAKFHPNKAISGYQGASLHWVNNHYEVDRGEAREIARKHAKAFFYALKYETNLHYVSSTINFGKQFGDFSQRVRLPSESLASNIGQSNCIDGSILFASLLENVDMEPFIALVPGHAFVGWRIWSGIDEYEFLETTVIQKQSFDEALFLGNNLYQQAHQKGDDVRDFLDAKGFMRIVDIAACRIKCIHPLPI